MKQLYFTNKKTYNPFSRYDPFSPKRKKKPHPDLRPNKRDILWKLLTVLICALLLFVGNRAASSGLSTAGTASDTEYFRTWVVNILGRDEQSFDVSENEVSKIVTLTFTAEIIDGDRAGEILTVVQQSDPYYQVELNEARVGDTVIVAAIDNDGEISYQYHAHVRIDPLIVVGVIFCVALLAFGHIKGLQTLFALAFTLLSVYSVLVPAILSGQNIYLWTIIVSLFLIAFPLVLRHGTRAETLLAGMGALASSAFMMGATAVMAKILELNGVVDEQSQYLSQINTATTIDLLGIVFACVCIGAVGALTDICWSTSSGLSEALHQKPTMSRPNLFRTGLTLGQARLSSVCQTMVVAFIGASLSATLLLFSSNLSLLSLFNRELVLVQILQMLTGLFGVLLSIPFTALLCSLLYTSAFKDVYTGMNTLEPAPEVAETNPETKNFIDTVLNFDDESSPADPTEPAAPAENTVEPEPVKDAKDVKQVQDVKEAKEVQNVPDDPEPDVEESAEVPEPVDPEELARREAIDAVEEDAQRTEAYRRGLFGNFARLYRELDEDFDVADEQSRKRHGTSKK